MSFEQSGIPREHFASPIAGRYALLDRLGVGGQGTVFEAIDQKVKPAPNQGQPHVAVKVYEPPTDKETADRIGREASMHFLLGQHPNIVTPLDYGVEPVRVAGLYGRGKRIMDYPYLVSELANGPSLHQRMHAGPLAISAIRRMVTEIGNAVHFAHREGVILRDLKPSNILGMIEGDDICNLLADFGIAKPLPSGLTGTGVHTRIGTLRYVSPEQARGEKLDPSSDIYSFGIMLQELLAGVAPFSLGAKDHRLPEGSAHLTMPLLEEVSAFSARSETERRVALALQPLALQAISEHPMDRPQTMKHFAWLFDQRYREAIEEPRASVHDLKAARRMPQSVAGRTEPEEVSLLPNQQLPRTLAAVSFMPAKVRPASPPLQSLATQQMPERAAHPGSGKRVRRTVAALTGLGLLLMIGDPVGVDSQLEPLPSHSASTNPNSPASAIPTSKRGTTESPPINPGGPVIPTCGTSCINIPPRVTPTPTKSCSPAAILPSLGLPSLKLTQNGLQICLPPVNVCCPTPTHT